MIKLFQIIIDFSSENMFFIARKMSLITSFEFKLKYLLQTKPNYSLEIENGALDRKTNFHKKFALYRT